MKKYEMHFYDVDDKIIKDAETLSEKNNISIEKALEKLVFPKYLCDCNDEFDTPEPLSSFPVPENYTNYYLKDGFIVSTSKYGDVSIIREFEEEKEAQHEKT